MITILTKFFPFFFHLSPFLYPLSLVHATPLLFHYVSLKTMKAHMAMVAVVTMIASQGLVSALPVPSQSMMVVDQLTVRGLGDSPLVVLGNYQNGNDNQSGNGNTQTSDSTTNVSGNANSVTSNSDGTTQNQSQNANQTNSSSSSNSDQSQSAGAPAGSSKSSSGSQPSGGQDVEQSNSQTTVQNSGGQSASQSSSSTQGNTQSSSQFLQRCIEPTA